MKIETRIVMPFYIPVRDGGQIVSDYHFGQIHVKFEILESKSDVDTHDVIPNRSVLNITCFPNESLSNKKGNQDLSREFVLSIINYINHLISAIRIQFHLSYLHHITVHDLPSILVLMIDGEGIMYFTDMFNVSEPLSDDELGMALSTMSSMEQYPDYFLTHEFYESALSEALKENYNKFIIDIETSFEIYIRNTLRLILIKKCMSKEEIEKVSSIPFRNVIEQHLTNHLGESLLFNSHPIINAWYKHIYTPRNELVHKGIPIANVGMVHKAIEEYNKAQKYIEELLIKNNYLDETGMVDLKLFRGDVEKPKYSTGIIEKMRKEGLIPEDPDIVQSDANSEAGKS